MDETSPEKEKMDESSDTFRAPLPISSIVQPSTKENSPQEGAGNKPASESTKPEKVTKKKLITVPLPYKEPDWGGSPPPSFNFEVIKNGTFVCTVPIRTSFFVFGRLDVCDVVFEHPSVSRYHAIIQYCRGDDLHPKGFYLYDLGSTHGTFLNKNPVKSKIYYKLKVGYILKFGGSSRLHVFQGPEEEDEEAGEKKPAPVPEPESCSWGINDDTEEEEEDENAVNPFAVSAPNEDLYLEDPKKTLRGWFEREGYELEYSVEEKGFKTFMCTVKLPVDTPTGEFLPVEASVSGKKKEAVIACALEACRTLDRLGLLRQSHQESRQKRKKKKWEENDFYDSDEDTFYDRTGEIEKRREMRKKMTKKTKAESFQTLETKLNDLNIEMDEVKRKLEACSKKKSHTGDGREEDSLESYMSGLAASADAPTDKFQRRKLMMRLAEAEKEKVHLEKLLNIAKPAVLPPVSKHLGMIGKRLKSRLHVPVSKPKVEEVKNESVEEEESDTEKIDDVKNHDLGDRNSPNPEKMEVDEINVSEKPKKYGLSFPCTSAVNEAENKEEGHGDKDTVSMNLENNVTERLNEAGNKDESQDDKDTVSMNFKNNATEKALAHDKKKVVQMDDETGSRYSIPLPKVSSKTNSKKNKNDVDVYKTASAEYTTWTPPANQSGDGITHLNAKYGF